MEDAKVHYVLFSYNYSPTERYRDDTLDPEITMATQNRKDSEEKISTRKPPRKKR